MDVIRRVLVALALSLALLAGRAPVALADAAPAAGPTPEQVRQLLGLLAHPAGRDWIARGAPAPPGARPPPPAARRRPPPPPRAAGPAGPVPPRAPGGEPRPPDRPRARRPRRAG